MIDHESLPRRLQPALARLCAVLRDYGSMVIAYSGGVDSGLLAYVAWRVLGRRMVAVMGISPSLGTREQRAAIDFLTAQHIPHDTIRTDEMENESYRANNPDRCYFCKLELFDGLGGIARVRGFSYVAYGANLDDRVDHRPGSVAADEKRAIAPLVDAGLDKQTIRDLAQALRLSLWDKPAAPCLASRVPYFSEVTTGKLAQIEAAEYVLKDLGFAVCRVRHHDDVARIEIPEPEHARILSDGVWSRVVAGITAAGFRHVMLEGDGFRSGRLNDVLTKKVR
ncbi:MAG: ATP-dependent sacrificial sulfur transferase LarE [Candidatus Krumholzibacteria bacterium]|nr:ATP-dependent sacrificial sulfur transferase LarE [Candidatus Krumholzibacteria bacterium]